MTPCTRLHAMCLSLSVVAIALSNAYSKAVSTEADAFVKASRILKATEVNAGLCVVLGDDKDGLAESLHNGGRMLVQKLTTTQQAATTTRDTLLSRGLYGLVSAEYHQAWSTLPYADGLVNLVVIDNYSELTRKGLTSKEVSRVLAPGGSVYLVNSGTATWTKSDGLSKTSATMARKAVSPDMDVWTHFDHGPENTACSKDKTVKPPRFVKWTTGQVDPKNKNMPNPAFRVENGRAFHLNVYDRGKTTVFARDAFNGTLLWQRDIVNLTTWYMKWMMIAHGDRFYIAPGITRGPVEAWDAATGETVVTYANADWSENLQGYEGVGELELLYCNDKLIQVVRSHLHVLDPTSGEVIWKYDSPDSTFLKFACASSGENLLFVTQSKVRFTADRWPFIPSVGEIICFNLLDGTERWRNRALEGKGVSQLSYSNGYLAVMGSNGIIGGGDNAARACIRVADNELIWSWDLAPDQQREVRSGHSMFVRRDTMYYNNGNSVIAADLATGGSSIYRYKGTDGSGNNQRCNRGFATTNYIQYGFGTWLGPNNTSTYTPIRRNSCATRGTPAYGMVYFTPAGCGCLKNVDDGVGFMALSSDSGRAVDHPSVSGGVTFGPADWVPGPSVSTHVLRKESGVAAIAVGPIVIDWPETRLGALGKRRNSHYQFGEYSFEVLSSRLQVRVYEGDSLISTVVTGGRVELAPVVYNKMAYIGSRDGTVYCLDLTTGLPSWRFMAAPYDRRIISASQLESSWPVTRLALNNGALSIDAGRHGGLVGGLVRYTLDPGTGAVLAKEIDRAIPDRWASLGQPPAPRGGERSGQPTGAARPATKSSTSRIRLHDLRGRRVSAGSGPEGAKASTRVVVKVYIVEDPTGAKPKVEKRLLAR